MILKLIRTLKMETFTPTHKIINTQDNSKILVQELCGDDEFYDLPEFETWEGDPVGIGNYALDVFDKDLILTRTIAINEEFGEVVAWNKAPHLKIKKICVKCHSDRIVKNGTNGYSQRYLCKDCGAVFTGTSLGRKPIGDRPMTNAEHQAKFRAKE